MPLSDMSEMEALIAITDFKLRKFLKEQMGYLKEIEEELESEDLEVMWRLGTPRVDIREDGRR